MIDRWMTIASRYDLHFFAAALALLSFSLPGREGPNSAGGVDVIALAKLGIRVLACGYFAIAFWSLMQKRIMRISPLLVPWILFAAWSLVTVGWSALPVVSIGQWMGLVALLAFSQMLAWRYADSLRVASIDKVGDSLSFSWIDIVVWIHAILFIYCFGVLCVHFVSPDLAGLNRMLWISGSNGVVHPTAAGATSSLGVLLGVFLYGRRLTPRRRILVAMILIELTLLYCSKSRSALLMTAVCFFVYGSFFTSKRVRGLTVLTLGASLLAVVTFDPGFEIIQSGVDWVGNYIKRGQTADQLKNASGRSEMWAAIWQQIQSSPILGHGYFVTSSNGQLDVWQGPSNQDAHNIVLQVWVTTGLIGMLPFAWAIWRMTRNIVAETDADFFWFNAILCLWYAGWSQGCVTFLGPIRPESVVFFTALGLLAGRVDWRRHLKASDNLTKAARSVPHDTLLSSGVMT